MAVDVEQILAHHGVLGQRWGVRNEESQKKEEKTPLSDEKKQFKKDLVKTGVLGGAALVILAGSKYLSAHPEILSRTANTIKGAKALDLGYDVVKLTLKDGRYVF